MMAPKWFKSRKARGKQRPGETDEKSPDVEGSQSKQPQPALSQEDLVRILKIIKKYSQ